MKIIMMIIAGIPKSAASVNELRHLKVRGNVAAIARRGSPYRRVSRRCIFAKLDAFESSSINEAGKPMD